MTRYLTTASGEVEACAIRARLAEAGIHVLEQGPLDKDGVAFAHSRDIYVDDCDLERSKTVLRAGGDFDEDELARLSEQAYREAVDP